jgi:hypothetical protein
MLMCSAGVLMRRSSVLLSFVVVPILVMVRSLMVMLGRGVMRSRVRMMLRGRVLSL